MRSLLLTWISALGMELHAQQVALKGRVTEPGGKAIAGALVSLKSRGLSDTSDASGNYALNGPGSSSLGGARAIPGKGTVTLAGRSVGVDLRAPLRVRVELFDSRGNLLATLLDKPLPEGRHRIDAEGHAAGSGMSLLRVSLGDGTAEFLLAPSSTGRGSTRYRPPRTAPGSPLPKSGAFEDALEASALGYKTRTVPIPSYEGQIDITLETEFPGPCIASRPAATTVRGSGPHSVVVETNAGDGIKEATIFRPADLGPGKKYPIVVWGEGGCSRDGLSNSASMAEIASHGYFVIADGTPNGAGSRPMNANNLAEMGRPMVAYLDWALAENRRPCSGYYRSLDTARIGANGYSCGGLLAMGVAKDPRITTWGLTSSGSFSDNPALWNSVHTPVLIIEGHKDETGAYTNGLRDYNGIAPLGHPIQFFSHRNLGHGGDLWSANGGDFTRIHLAWLNWWLKGDTGTTGKGSLVGPGCRYCSNSVWEVRSANLP